MTAKARKQMASDTSTCYREHVVLPTVRYEALAPADASAMTAEARMRLLSGLKRFFHSKRAEGLVSGQVRAFDCNDLAWISLHCCPLASWQFLACWYELAGLSYEANVQQDQWCQAYASESRPPLLQSVHILNFAWASTPGTLSILQISPVPSIAAGCAHPGLCLRHSDGLCR